MNKIDGKLFAEMIAAGANNLSQNAEYVDSLNVFLYRMVTQELI